MRDETPTVELADVELAPIRALTDGLILPALLASPAFLPAMDTARIGYSTRYQPQGNLGDAFLDSAARFARDRQTQRSERACNADWEVVWPQLLPGLMASVVMWLQMTGMSAESPEIETVLRLLGLDVGTHRRVKLMRSAVDAGLLVEPRAKLWRLAPHADEIVERECPWAPLFVGLNQVVPAAYQRFNQVPGSILSWRGLRQTPRRLRQIHERLAGKIARVCQDASSPWKAVRSGLLGHHVILATFHTLSRMESEPGLSPDLTAGQRLVFLGPVAEAMKRIGPWSVASHLVRRRFVERVQGDTGLSGVQLYEFISRRYQVRSDNSVRAFLKGPPLVQPGEQVNFNRGLIHQVAFAARNVLAQVGREELPERHLRERVGRHRGIPNFDVGVWQAAIGLLEEEDIVRRFPRPTGIAFTLRSEETALSRATLEQLEAGAKVVLSRVPYIANAVAAGEPSARAATKFWLVPRSALSSLRTQIVEAIGEVVQDATAANIELTEMDEQHRGMILGEFLVTTRILPLAPLSRNM